MTEDRALEQHVDHRLYEQRPAVLYGDNLPPTGDSENTLQAAIRSCRNELTGEMINAGVQALRRWEALSDPIYKTPANLCAEVWSAVEALRRQELSPSERCDP